MDSIKHISKGFPGSSEVKASACNTGELGLIPRLGRSPGEGKSNPLQYSCLENPIDRGAWWAAVHGVAKSRTQLSDFTSLHFSLTRYFHFLCFSYPFSIDECSLLLVSLDSPDMHK